MCFLPNSPVARFRFHGSPKMNGLILRTSVAFFPYILSGVIPDHFSPVSLVLAHVCHVHGLLHSVVGQAFGSCFAQQKHQLRA
jgi:hypothetical protein